MLSKTKVPSTISFTSIVGYYNIINVVLASCSSTAYGGGIFVEVEGSTIGVSYCLFDQCSATTGGGGICVRKSVEIRLYSSCFYECYSQNHCNSFWFTVFVPNLRCFVNKTDSYSTRSSIASSYTYGSQISIICESNCSYEVTSKYSSGFGISNYVDGTGARYNQVANTKGVSFWGFYVYATSLKSLIEFSNFINCTTTSGWFEIRLNTLSLQVVSCCLINVSKSSVQCTNNNGVASLTFNGNFISIAYDSVYHPSLMNESNSFGLNNLTPIPISLMRTDICWSSYAIDQSCSIRYQTFFISALSMAITKNIVLLPFMYSF